MSELQIIWIVLYSAASVWVAIDSKRIGATRYKSMMAMGPVAMFLCSLFFCGLTIPFYLVFRSRVKRGLVPLKVAPP
jgi:hypothetical protein